MLVLELNDGKHPGKMSNRNDFPPADRMLAVLERQEANEDDHDRSMKNCDQNLSGKVRIIRKSGGRRHHLHLQQIGGSQENGMNHNKKNGKISSGGKSGEYSRSEPSNFFLQESCTSANFLHATGSEDSTPRTRDTDAHVFLVLWSRDSRAGHINAHALAQKCFECLSLCAHQQIHALQFRPHHLLHSLRCY